MGPKKERKIKLHGSYGWILMLEKSQKILTVPDNWPIGLTYFSSNWLASPLLSPLIKWFVLFMEVGWTANQLITPIGSFVSEWNMFIWWTPWSVSCSYLETKQCTMYLNSSQYVKEYPDLVNHCGYSYSLVCIWLSNILKYQYLSLIEICSFDQYHVHTYN